jgi:hypothetical protein
VSPQPDGRGDLVARLEDHEVDAPLDEIRGRGQPDGTGADDHDRQRGEPIAGHGAYGQIQQCHDETSKISMGVDVKYRRIYRSLSISSIVDVWSP